MSYKGAAVAAESRGQLGNVLERLQLEPNLPPDVLIVTQNLAQAVGALFEAERASSDVDGKASVKHAMGSLSQTMALLQEVRSQHPGISTATKALAEVMGKLYPLSQMPSMRPGAQPSVRPNPPVPATAPLPPEAQRVSIPGSRAPLEANVGATTESNFFVGFSGEISEGGVFVATYQTIEIGEKVEVLVTLPGGFERKIPGTVRFVRDPMDMDSEPGIGVRFDRLEDEARELILRFIRKRPPLFYDE
ncbi:MAG TPA: PilZ domain-containing protein [Polyangiales bacterium]|nr:PilZ domain-containing protein [Polyangiales bacterium]